MAYAEQKKSYQVIKAFKGLNTKANRTAIDKDEFSWLENAMPVGSGNMRIIPTSSNVTNGANAVVFTNNVTYLTSANINDDYIVAAEDNGALQAFDLSSNNFVTIASTGTLSMPTYLARNTKILTCLWVTPTRVCLTGTGLV